MTFGVFVNKEIKTMIYCRIVPQYGGWIGVLFILCMLQAEGERIKCIHECELCGYLFFF